jgi:hypothetical protein
MKNYGLIILVVLIAGRSWAQTCSGNFTVSKTAICLTQSITLQVTSCNSGTITWSVATDQAGPYTDIGASSISFTCNTTFTYTPPAAGSYWYKATLASCAYNPIKVDVSIGSVPPAPTLTAATTCPNVTFSVPQDGTNTVVWYENTGFFWSEKAGTMATSLVVPHPASASSTYRYRAEYKNAFCYGSPSNEISVINYGIPAYLSAATSSDVYFVYETGNGLVPQKDNCNKLLMSFEGGGNNRIKANVTIDAVVNSYNGRPYLKRHYDLTPAPNGTYPQTPSTYSVRLFFTQTEFDQLNAAISPQSPKLPRQPNGTYGHFNDDGYFVADPTSSEIYYGNSEQVNLRVLQAHGEPAVAGGGPGAYSSVDELVNLSNCTGFGCKAQTFWNANYQIWQVTILNLTSFSGFFITAKNATALPVTLADFRAQPDETAINLHWKTVAETNFSHYEIQRSTHPASGFENVGTLKNQGSATGGTYTFRDDQVSPGNWYYYRLRMVDLDGSFAYSRIIASRLGQEVGIKVFPNPAHTELTFTSAERITEYKLINASGQLIQRKADLLTDREMIVLPSLPVGTYLLHLQTESGRTETRHVVIQ